MNNFYSLSLKKVLALSILASLSVVFAGCGGGSGSGRSEGSAGSDFGCNGSCQNLSLTVDDVTKILRQASSAASLLGTKTTVAVVDRVGNVLAVYQQPGSVTSSVVNGQIGAVGGLEGVAVPSTLAAISKAGTGAYLSSQGNSFSTRTASQIVQEHFNPGELNQLGGPLFGVQFSQLFCSDVTVRQAEFASGLSSGRKIRATGLVGPRPLPLGLSGDPGGFPLYKNGDLVGGIGIEFDGAYSLDRDVRDTDTAPEELVAITASRGFEAPSERVASNMIVGGKALRFSDISYSEALVLPESLEALDNSGFFAIAEYTDGSIRAGATFGSPGSGIARTTRAGQSSMTLVGDGGAERFPLRDGASTGTGLFLAASEVNAILDSALVTASRARGAIRRPLDSQAHVSIWVIDQNGTPLGFTRTSDAPVFGIDVALQKARSAAFFSSAQARDQLIAARQSNGFGAFDDYLSKLQVFLGGEALTGTIAFTNRAIGNLARPYFPDGIVGDVHGPLSLPFPGRGVGRTWSPFNVGLQLDFVIQRFAASLGLPSTPASLPDSCVSRTIFGDALANGLQIFPGSVPLYKGGTLVGALGISGDGIDQDDMIAFYGASRRGLDTAGHTTVGDANLGFNAPLEIRSDQVELLVDQTVRLRYVNCPEAPFIGSDEQNVCDKL